MSRGIFRVKPELTPYISTNLGDYLSLALGETYQSDIKFAKVMKDPEKYINDIQLETKILITVIATFVDNIIASNQFLGLFGQDYIADKTKLGGQVFNNDKTELVKSYYNLIVSSIKKDVPYDLIKESLNKMKKV